MIPRLAHFVFGLREQREPFHFLHYVALESCRRVLRPERIYFHHKHVPWGPWWDRVAPHLTLADVDEVADVVAADRLPGRVPDEYLYAHHADFIRLDALIEHGGVYADIDTVFVRSFDEDLFDAPFVIGREPDVRDERTGELRPSLCNALMMCERGSRYARAWRERMATELNGTWSNHSGFLAQSLSIEMPDEVRIEPEVSFFPFSPTPAGIADLLERQVTVPAEAYSVHLWAHLWWKRGRRDFTAGHAGWCAPPVIDAAPTTIAEIARPYLPAVRAGDAPSDRSVAVPAPARWRYLSLDEDTGYGISAGRSIAALRGAGVSVEPIPFIPGRGWGLGYEPGPPWASSLNSAPFARGPGSEASREVVVAHLVPEYFPPIRTRSPQSFLVGATVWDTDRIPEHWITCLQQADLLIVPSQFSAEAIRRSPVTTPVEVVPHVASWTDADGEMRPRTVPEDVFVFYTIGEWTERKAVDKTVEAYLRAFTSRDRVLLIVKSSHRDHRSELTNRQTVGEGTSAWALARLLARHPDAPAVSLITRELTDAEIAGLHVRGDCYVSLCRSEGFGLGAFDAAARGIPVVMTGFGGQLEYLAGSPYLVGFDLVPVVDPPHFPSYAPDQRWGEPDIEHGAALLRAVARDPARARQAFAPIAADIRERFGPGTVGPAFVSAVERHRSQARAAAASLVAAERKA